MLLKKGGIVVILLVLCAAIAIAPVSAANADTKNSADSHGYVITIGTGHSTGKLPVAGTSPMTSISNSIGQGQFQYASKTISGYCPGFNIDLYWGNPSSSLRLRIYTPDGAVLGPYYDNWDGMLNGDIPVYISRSGGVAQGTYYFEIYGDSVPSGSQWYSLTA